MKRTNRFRRVRNRNSPGRFIRRLRRRRMIKQFKIRVEKRLFNKVGVT